MGHFHVFLPPELHKDLKQRALDQNKTLKQVILEILKNSTKMKRVQAFIENHEFVAITGFIVLCMVIKWLIKVEF